MRREALNSFAKTIVITGPAAYSGSSATNVVLAKQIPGAKLVFCSENEAEKKYHSYTSGQAFVLDATGKLLFSGGLTDSRGLAGESIGMASLLGALRGERCVHSAPVFGCALSTSRGT
jgi:hypothetical protein